MKLNNEVEQSIRNKFKIDSTKKYNIFLCYRDSTAILARNFYDYVQRINVSLYDTRYYGNIYYSDYIACGRYTDYDSLKKLINDDELNYFIIFLDKNFTANFTTVKNVINEDCVTAHEIKFLLERKNKPRIIVVNVNGYNFRDFYNEQFIEEEVKKILNDKNYITNKLRDNYFELTNIDNNRIMNLLDDNYSVEEKKELAKFITKGNNINNFDVRQGDETSFFERLLASIEPIPVKEEFYEFGSYPQDSLLDEELKTKKIFTPDFEKWNSYQYSYNGQLKDYMKYYDLKDENIRAVKFTEYRPCLISGIPSSYQLKNGFEKDIVHYFYFEPLIWRKLYEDRLYLYLCTKDIIDSQPFSNYNYDELLQNNDANDFDKSFLKKWLNETFYNSAFNEEEKELIDKGFGVSLLSVDDVINHMMTTKRNKIGATRYAMCQGVYSYDSNYDWFLKDKADGNDNTIDVKFICGNKFDEIKEDFSIYTNGGIIPLIRIKKSMLLMKKNSYEIKIMNSS